MALDNQDILFASLLGSAAVGSVQRFNSLQNELAKRVLPPIPFLPLKNNEGIQKDDYLETFNNLWQADTPLTESQQFFPLKFSFSDNGPTWLFPYEPMISISSGNVLPKAM